MRKNAAPVAELVDAPDSKSGYRQGVLVRVRPGAPIPLIIALAGRWRAHDVRPCPPKPARLPAKNPPSTAAAVVVVAGVLALATVFFFQYVLLILPCHLCLEQRIAYYTAVPARGPAVARREPWCCAQGSGARLRGDRRHHAVERRAFALSRRRRMEVVAGPDRLLGPDQQFRLGRRYDEPIEAHQPGALR